jgi:hypothetical protein
LKIFFLSAIVFFAFLNQALAISISDDDLRPMIREALNMRGQQLLALTPTDIADFCPNIDMQNTENRARFWEDFFLAYINLESGRNPSASFVDRIQDPSKVRGQMYRSVEHVGLMQVSTEASTMVGCVARSRRDLRDPQKNITCGVQIMNQLIPVSNSGSIRDGRNPSYANFERTRRQNISNPPTDLSSIWGNENFPAYPLGKNGRVFTRLRRDVGSRCASYSVPNGSPGEQSAPPASTEN